MPCPLLIVVTGLPCAGKTVLAARIAREFGLPLVTKDDIKEGIFDSLGWGDRDWSRRVGAASIQLLYYSMELLLTAGSSLVVESNFKPEVDAQRFRDLRHRYSFAPLVIHCKARGEVLLERFRRRVASGERHPGHVDHLNSVEFEPILLAGDPKPLEIGGPVLEIDTTEFEAIDYESLFRTIGTMSTEVS